MSEDKKPKYNKEQNEILLRCSENKDMSEWNEYRNKHAGLEIDISVQNLEGANLFYLNLEGAYLGSVNLEGINLAGANLKGAVIFDAHLEGANLRNANLDRAKLTDIHIGNYENQKKIEKKTNFKGTFFGNAVLSINKYIEDNTGKNIKMLSNGVVNNIQFIDPVFGRKVRDEAWLYHFKNSCKENKWKNRFLKIWKYSSDYGRNIGLWALWSLNISIMFALIFIGFYLSNPEYFQAVYVSELVPGFSFLYYSIVTFTTLGFGDIVPKHGLLQFIVMIEVILGYIMLGGLISIFANKLARRND